MPPIIEDSLIPQEPLLEGVDATTTSPLVDYKQQQEKELYDFALARIKLQRLVDDWKCEVDKTAERRRKRDVEIDIKGLRQSGKLDEDETIIPDRVIDTNIQREVPPYINYLKNSRRLAIFTCISNPDINPQRLELEFTQGMSYINWEIPHVKGIDGAQTHGWDWVEVVFDPSKPLSVALEHVGHENLFFPMSCKDIQSAGKIVRSYDVTIKELQSYVSEFGFSEAEVGKLIDKVRDSKDEPETIRIYKEFCKYDGVVYVAWFSLEGAVSDWLKKPMPLFLGISHQEQAPAPPMGLGGMMQSQPGVTWADTPIRDYPVYLLPYRVHETQKLVSHKGRVYYDEFKQEAQTAVLSGFVNGMTRASNMYASAGQDDGSGSSIKEVQDIILEGGRILNKPINFFSPPYPDPMVLKALQYFDVSNDVELGQPNFAAMNRQDSRKTAKEIGAAQEQQQMLNSVALTLFSTYIRSVYSLVWLIVQSQALQGKIKFLLVQKQRPQINPVTNGPVMDPMTGQPVLETYWTNDLETIAEVYDIRAAGDVDVIQKSEKVMQMKQDWPVISQTPLAQPFLAELLRLQYPDTGEKWAQMLESQTGIVAMQQTINALAQMLMGVMKDYPEIFAQLPPEQQQQVIMVIQQAQQLAGQAAQQPESGTPSVPATTEQPQEQS